MRASRPEGLGVQIPLRPSIWRKGGACPGCGGTSPVRVLSPASREEKEGRVPSDLLSDAFRPKCSQC